MTRDRAAEKRIAVVTGGNRGIGFEICRQLAQRGVHVILASRDVARGAAAQRVLADAGLDVANHQLDVTDTRSILQLASTIRQTHERLDILVNNAAVYIDDRHRLLDVDIEVMARSMATNAFGPLLLVQSLAPLMIENGYGRIVNVSSGVGELGSLGSSDPAYRTSKIVLNIYTRILASELAGTGVLVNAMCPGWVRTDMGGAGAPLSAAEGADTAVWLAMLPDDGPSGGFFRDRVPIPW